MSDDPKLDFFVSYTGCDAAWAEWVAWQLEGHGYTTVIQAWDFLPGSNFAIKMNEAARRAERTLGVISQAYFQSEATAAEWAAALARNFDGDRRTYIPIRIEHFDPEGLHRPIVYVNVFGCHEDDARAALLDGVPPPNGAGAVFGAERRKPASAPAFPGQIAREASPDDHAGRPTAWNIPHESTAFEGRRQALEAIEAHLSEQGRATVTQMHAVHGLGGVGKTRLVTHYANLHRDEYDVGWWIRAEQESTRLEDLAALGATLRLPQAADGDLPALALATLAWLESSSRWLLVIDNAPNPDAAASVLPADGDGHVLITSRAYADWAEIGAEQLPLDVWGRDESIDFLLKRTNRGERQSANDIAELLGDLPLALTQAASYSVTTAISLDAYLMRLQNNTGRLLAKGEPRDYKDTVAGTWTLAFEQIRSDDAATQLLSICAYLAPERIPRELLDLVVAGESASADGDETHGAADGAIQVLLSYSLLTPSKDETLDMHRLVQQIVRGSHEQAQQASVLGTALGLLLERFSYDVSDPSTWPVTGRLLAHILAIAQHAETHSETQLAVSELLRVLCIYLRSRAEFAQALELGERAVATAEASLGPNHFVVGEALTSLGTVLEELGQLNAARGMHERALAIQEATYGPNDPRVAVVLGNLGNALEQLGELNAARENHERALTIEEDVYGPSHFEVGATLNNLGIVLARLGELDAAREKQERALVIKEDVYGPYHPEVALTLNNLGIVFARLGELDAARETQRRALTINEQTYGRSHPGVAATLGNLGNLFAALGELDAAREKYEQTLAIEEDVYGPNHPEVGVTLNNLAIVLERLGERDAARETQERAFKIIDATSPSKTSM